MTKKEKAALDAIIKRVEERGQPPTIRQLCRALNVNSTSQVHKLVKGLEELGLVKNPRPKGRAEYWPVAYCPNCGKEL